MQVDLHSHTTASDGLLSPAALIERAREVGLDLLAITDHDSIAGEAVALAAATSGLTLISGIEFSTFWQRHGIHIVGLNFARDSAAMQAALDYQGRARHARAERIAERIRKRGIHDALAGAARLAGTGSIGRPHFAAYLVSIGACANSEQAFKQFLDPRHTGVLHEGWAALPTIIDWIRAAGGTAVLAHPAKYRLTRKQLAELARTFKAAGGTALEVISGQQPPDVTRDMAELAVQHGLQAALGSDFHRLGQPWAALGRLAPLPASCVPVWEHW